MILSHSFFRFLLVGFLGFFVDYTVFSLLYDDLGSTLARLISILVAIFTTWIFNRRYTFSFKERNIIREFLKYLYFSKVSLIVNYIIFMLSVKLLGTSFITGYILATGVSMFFNYNFYRTI